MRRREGFGRPVPAISCGDPTAEEERNQIRQGFLEAATMMRIGGGFEELRAEVTGVPSSAHEIGPDGRKALPVGLLTFRSPMPLFS